MNRQLIFLGLAALAAPVTAQRAAMPRGSFLQAPARSTQSLLKQFDTNPEVSRRYINLFGRSKTETRQILSRLSTKPLTDSHRYPIAFYSGKGQWQYEVKTLQEGTVVFITPEGKPFLKQECGNPLVDRLPYAIGEGVPTRAPIKLPRSLDPAPRAVTVAVRPPDEILAEPSDAYNAPTLTLPSFDLTEPESDGKLVMALPEGSPGLLAAPGLPPSREIPSWLAFLLPILLLLGLGGSSTGVPIPGGGAGGPGPGGSGGNSGGTPPGEPIRPPSPPNVPPVVPEASAWMLMVAGAAALPLMIRRRKTKGQTER